MSKVPPKAAPTPYFSNGKLVARPPLKVRLANLIDRIVLFMGLYLTTLFSLDPYNSGLISAYNIHNRVKDGTAVGRGKFGRRNNKRGDSGAGSGGGGSDGGGGGGGGGGGSGSGFDGRGGGAGRRLGQVADIRGPECKSCG